MAVNVKMGVDIGAFKSGIKEGQSILKGLNVEMKAAEAEFKATGNAEKLLESKTKTLTSQLNVQKGIADKAQKALKQMKDAGVDPASKAYQDMYTQLMNATAGANEAQAALNDLGKSANDAAAGADKLTASVQGISKKISLDQVISGVNSITSGLENAAKKAVSLGEAIWNTVMDTAAWSDDVGTLADRMGLSTEEVQKMMAVAAEFEAPVETMAKTWKKVKMNMTSDSKDVAEAFKQLGLSTKEWGQVEGQSGPALVAKNYRDMFWEIGQGLMKVSDESKRERLAETLLGKSWDELAPLFKKGRQAYEDAMAEVSTASDEAIQNNAALADSVAQLEVQFDIFKAEILGNISPELQKVTDTFSSLLGAITDYMKTPEGQEMLKGIGDAIGSLVDDIANIDPESVVATFSSIIQGVVDTLDWVITHKDEVIGAMEGVVLGWAALNVTGGILDIVKIIDGLVGLTGIATGAGAAGAEAGAAFGAAFLQAFISVSPALAAFLGITAVATAPAVGAQKANEEEWKRKQQEREEAAKLDKNNYDFLMDAAGALGPKKKADGTYETGALGFLDMNPTSAIDQTLYGLKERNNQQRAELMSIIRQYAPYTAGNFTTDLLMEYWNNPGAEKFDAGMVDELLTSVTDAITKNAQKKVELPTELVTPPDEAKQIAKQVETVFIPAQLQVSGIVWGGFSSEAGSRNGQFPSLRLGWPSGTEHDPLMAIPHANGLPYVPYDGYLARLHKGERVVPARQAGSSFSSNLYVENMNMSGGLSADALAASIASRNRRVMAGYGS